MRLHHRINIGKTEQSEGLFHPAKTGSITTSPHKIAPHADRDDEPNANRNQTNRNRNGQVVRRASRSARLPRFSTHNLTLTMADYPAEAFPYVFICSWCEAEQPVTRREAIDLGGHLLGSEDAAEFALGEKYGWTLATPLDLICPECAEEGKPEGGK